MAVTLIVHAWVSKIISDDNENHAFFALFCVSAKSSLFDKTCTFGALQRGVVAVKRHVKES